MWSDVILTAERQHLLRLLMWAALSIVLGTAVAAILAVRRARSPLLKHFALQMAVWGVVVGAIAAVRWNALHLRDVAGATRLERSEWLLIGLDVGVVAVGVALAVVARVLERRLALLGAGTAVIIQGAALLLLDLQFAVLVSR